MTNSYTKKKKKRKKKIFKKLVFQLVWKKVTESFQCDTRWTRLGYDSAITKIRGREKRAGWNLAYWRAMKAKRATINIEPPREMHTPIRANEIPSHGERIRSFKNAGLTGSLFDLLLAESSVGKIHFRKRVIPLFASLLLPFLKKTQ